MSSINTITTLGALFGAFTSNLAGAFALRASNSVIAGYTGSFMGRTVRSNSPAGIASAVSVFGCCVQLNVIPDTAMSSNDPSWDLGFIRF